MLVLFMSYQLIMQNKNQKSSPKETIIYIDKIIEVTKPFYVEVPVYIDRIVEVEKDQNGNKKIIGEQKIVEKIKIVQVPVQKIVEKEVRIEKIVEVEVEVIKEVFIEIPIEIIKQVPIEIIREVQVIREVPIEVIRQVEVPVQRYIQQKIQVPIEVIRQVIVQRQIQRYVQVPVEVIRQVPSKIKPFLVPRLFLENILHGLNKILKRIHQEIAIQCIQKFKINYRIQKIITTVLQNFIYSRKHLLLPAAFEKIKAVPKYANKRLFKVKKYQQNLQNYNKKVLQRSFDYFKRQYLEGYALKKTAYIKIIETNCKPEKKLYSRWHKIAQDIMSIQKSNYTINCFEMLNKIVRERCFQDIIHHQSLKIEQNLMKLSETQQTQKSKTKIIQKQEFKFP